MNPKLATRIDEIVKCFDVDQDLLLRGVDYFIEMANKHLAEEDVNEDGLPMVPTYVTSIPKGDEKGVLLACDLGGTNFRVVSVTLNGDRTFDLLQAKSRIPQDLFTGKVDDLFAWLAKKIGQFVEKNHGESKVGDKLKLGFTFSFPVNQTSLDSGTLLRWSKGFNIPEAIGMDIVELLQKHLDNQKIPVHVAALANDTVGTLLARSYTGQNKEGETLIGCIFGTGTNGAYPEPLDNITKMPVDIREDLKKKGVDRMVINTEWGSFDLAMKVLPNTKWDTMVDNNSVNKGFHIFEKRVSGMYLGEILRCVLYDLWQDRKLFTQYQTEDDLPHRLRTPWSLSTEAMSLFEIDDSTDLKATGLQLQQMLRLPTNVEERLAIQKLTRAISRRSAYISAIPIAAILIKLEALSGHHIEIDIGADGSVVEFYPGYRTMVRDAISLTQLGPKGERRIHINISKDGSSVGAALCALSSDA